MERFSIAGLGVEMEPKYDVLYARSRRYLSDAKGGPDISIPFSERLMARAKELYPDVDDPTAEYLYTAEVFYETLVRWNGFMLHSSAVAYGGRAYLFTADSGTGKSTHTGLWQKYIPGISVINDDKPAVRLTDGVFRAAGTPWSGKYDISGNVSYPLGGVAVVIRGTENRIEPASPAETVRTLLKQTVIPYRESDYSLLAETLDRFVSAVPVYNLWCDMSENAVRTSFEKLTGEKYDRISMTGK